MVLNKGSKPVQSAAKSNKSFKEPVNITIYRLFYILPYRKTYKSPRNLPASFVALFKSNKNCHESTLNKMNINLLQ